MSKIHHMQQSYTATAAIAAKMAKQDSSDQSGLRHGERSTYSLSKMESGVGGKHFGSCLRTELANGKFPIILGGYIARRRVLTLNPAYACKFYHVLILYSDYLNCIKA